MKLIIESSRKVDTLQTLSSLGEFVENLFMVWVEETNESYIFFKALTLDGIQNTYGTWQKVPYVNLLGLTFEDIPDEYTEITYSDLTDFSFSVKHKLTGDQATKLRAVLGYLPKYVELAHTSEVEVIQVPTEGIYTISIPGYNFSDLVVCELSSGSIQEVDVNSDTELNITITGLIFNNTSTLTITYPGGYFREFLLECVPLPAGKTLPILNKTYTANKNYSGIGFAKSSYSSYYEGLKAFDDNVGTRHYAARGYSTNHYCGILGDYPSYLISIEYEGEYGSSVFRLEGSQNTTDGHDGDWDNLGEYDLSSKKTLKSKNYVYMAYRIVWISPISTSWANAREITFRVKQ